MIFPIVFYRRSKVLNQFALKAEIQQQIGSREVDGEKLDTKAKNLVSKLICFLCKIYFDL